MPQKYKTDQEPKAQSNTSAKKMVKIRLKIHKIKYWYHKSSAVAKMGDRLATIDMGRKAGCCCAPFRGGDGSHLTQCRLGRGLPPYQVAS